MSEPSLIEVSIADQALRLIEGDTVTQFSISTALNGVGEQEGSGCTPRGWHRICAVIGQGQPEGSVFVGRRVTGEIYSTELAQAYPHRDWILSRILWLQGLEVGKNRFGSVDSQRRFIYIHGTPDTEPMGEAKSHGCIRMRNADVITLAERVSAATRVWIQEASFQRICCINVP
ncbi:MAG: hypothetical protein CSH37_04595 [Thalassolituus sp.]|jgi:lipoprotein-anchoring transpeptidase ErfK/SrfK|nr:MAG: hypothetical protein CSH37_04595 [Thalassolituus sp.]